MLAKKKAPAVRESQVEKYFITAVAQSGAQQRKFKTPNRRGAPDRIVLAMGGRVCFCEIKRPGEEPRPDQLREHKRLRDMGFEVFVLDSYETVDNFLESWI